MDTGTFASGHSQAASSEVTEVAIVHDYLTQRGGAERLVLSMVDAFPGSPVYTSFYEPTQTYEEYEDVEVVASPINMNRFLRKDPRRALPFLGKVFSEMRVEADIAICSTTGWAHGADVTGQRLIYCNNPARWLYQTDQYLPNRWSPQRIMLEALRPRLERWDQAAARSADRYVGNSTAVCERIRSVYGIEAEVVFPAVSPDTDGPDEIYANAGDSFYLVVARLHDYKGVEAVVEAFAGSSHRLVVVGQGPLLGHLRRIVSNNVVIAGAVSDEHLRWLYRNTTAVITAAYEDFGLVPVEAAAYGKPTIALRFGGHLDTVRHGETGWLFDDPTPSSVAEAIEQSSELDFDPTILRDHAMLFSPERFIDRMRAIVSEMTS